MLTVVIQAGGQSTRMGQNKALMPFLGQPLIKRIIERLQPISNEIFITANQFSDYEQFNLPLFSDVQPDGGALSGLHTALYHASFPYVAVVACDMPFANSALLQHFAELLDVENADVVIPRVEGEYEPLHAIYRRETCLQPIESALQEKRLRLISWFNQVRVCEVGISEIKPFDPHELAFWNLNTPDEFVQAEKTASEIEK